MQNHSYITLLLLILSNIAIAQNMPHLNFWSRVSLTQPINEKWKTEIEIQHRRQNNYTEQTDNVFQETLLSSVRTWVHYQHKENIGFSLSPFAYYWHNPIIVTNADIQKPEIQEMRFSGAVDLKQELIKKLWLIDRTCIEYRDFQNTDVDFIRLRNRLGLRYEFNSKWNITVFNEVFLTIKGVPSTHLFDHDRIGLLLNYKLSKNTRIETGYLYISRLPRNSEELLQENNFLIHLYFTFNHLKKHTT